MKRLFALLLCITTILVSYAQDVLIKADGSTEVCKVEEVSISLIKYKKWSNLEGPTYSILISNVESIHYANGDVDKFSNSEAVATEEEEPQKVTIITDPESKKMTFKPNKEELISEFYDDNNHSIDWMIEDLRHSYRRRSFWGYVLPLATLVVGGVIGMPIYIGVPLLIAEAALFMYSAQKYANEADRLERLKNISDDYSYSPNLMDEFEPENFIIAPSADLTADINNNK